MIQTHKKTVAFTDRNYTLEETEFAVFCVENVAEYLGKSPTEIYDVFTKESNLMDDYIIPCYDILHTQGKEYIVENLLDVMKERGIKL